MKKTSMLFMAVGIIAMLAAGLVMAADETAKGKEEKKAAHEYVGAKKCKICHKEQFTTWSESPHAKAFSVLSAEEQKKDECVRCHITGTKPDGTVIENVECEACHGPGKDYKSPKIMSKKKWPAEPEKYKQMAIDAGLVYPTEETCVRCHTKEGNANFKEFDFEKFKTKVHAMSADEKPAKGK